MKIVMCHEYYQRRGGEDEVFDLETALLRREGHEVIVRTAHNDEIRQRSLLRTGLGALWNQRQYREFRDLVRQEKPDIVHFYNTFPLISPAAIHGAKSAGATVVQSLHNYRLMCVNASLFRELKPCENCVGSTVPLAGVKHGCYHDSRVQSAAVAAMLATHSLASTWTSKVDLFLLGSTEFALARFEKAGLDPTRIVLKPNFVSPDPGIGDGAGGYALFVGRFDAEKGVEDLLRAWKLHEPQRKLVIVGDGPLAELVAAATERLPNVEWLGRQTLEEMYETMKHAAFLVFPSRWYEAMPRTILDAFAVGTPVLASRVGVMQHLIREDQTGRFFEPGSARSLQRESERMFRQGEPLSAMRNAARRAYETSYTADQNYKLIIDAYRRAIDSAA
ncbi:MAG: glycosyltransferase [Xanthomonadales bacterium]|nr:glycosyltransferase [Gammaproteobacteria bacterium]NNE04455.1 glycosyltransferase [Xanthomonadales bacterium]NNL96351.1 glycosyltransferase [Xanthomonadales bacterium]